MNTKTKDRRSITVVRKTRPTYMTWVLDRYLGITSMKAEQADHILYRALPDLVTCCNTNNYVYLVKQSTTKRAQQLQGTLQSTFKNMNQGIRSGTEIRLKLNGVGYKAKIDGKYIILDVGFSHPVSLEIPEGIKVTMVDNTSVVLFSMDKEKVGSFAAILRAIRPPEPYKGKGIQYVNEVVTLKSGKSKR